MGTSEKEKWGVNRACSRLCAASQSQAGSWRKSTNEKRGLTQYFGGVEFRLVYY